MHLNTFFLMNPQVSPDCHRGPWHKKVKNLSFRICH